jgi:predicted Zn-dependent protease with MMP-like domain
VLRSQCVCAGNGGPAPIIRGEQGVYGGLVLAAGALRGADAVRVVADQAEIDHPPRLLIRTRHSGGRGSVAGKMRKSLRRWRRLDPAQGGSSYCRRLAVLSVSRSRFDVLVDDALDTIPERLLGMLDNVVVQTADEDPDDPTLLGVYRGTALTERLSDYTFALPDTITIYRLPILAQCADEAEVAREVAITVVHEIGHHFGIDEERLHELGWG